MKKNNIKQKKSEITGNKDMAHNSWYTERGIAMNIISEYLKQGYHMPRRQFKTIGQGFQVKTYKKRR